MSRLTTVPGSRSLSGLGERTPRAASFYGEAEEAFHLSGGDSEGETEGSPRSVTSPHRHRLHRALSLGVGTMRCGGEEWRARPVMVGVPRWGEEVGTLDHPGEG